MLKETELRIGNRIQRGNMEVIVGWGTIRMLSDGHDVGRGIVITRDWIEKLGLEVTKEGDGFTGGAGSNYEKDGIKLHSCEGLIFVDGVRSQCGIKYVHEFQNLWFALTGKEIKF